MLRVLVILGVGLSVPGAAAEKEGATASTPTGSGALKKKTEATSSQAVKPSGDRPAQKKPGKPDIDVARMPFDARSIQEVVRFHMSEIQACYEEALRESGTKIEGRVQVNFVIDPTGTVTYAKANAKKSTVSEPRVVDCVVETLRKWPFPKPSDNRDHPIDYPFELRVLR
jgi:hypothetical protein